MCGSFLRTDLYHQAIKKYCFEPKAFHQETYNLNIASEPQKFDMLVKKCKIISVVERAKQTNKQKTPRHTPDFTDAETQHCSPGSTQRDKFAQILFILEVT